MGLITNTVTKVSKAGIYAKTAGVLTVVCVIGGSGYLGYRVVQTQTQKKNQAQTQTQNKGTANQTQTQSQVSEQQNINYDGVYVGTANAAQGLTGATLTVQGTKISGPGTYKSIILGQTNTATVNVTGTISDKGAVKGTFSGTGSVMGRSVQIGGSTSGTTKNGVMSLTWAATVYGEKVTGKITLNKR